MYCKDTNEWMRSDTKWNVQWFYDRHCFDCMISTNMSRPCLCDALLPVMLNEWWNNSDELKNEFNLWASGLGAGISSNCQQVMWEHSRFTCPTLHMGPHPTSTTGVCSSQVWYDLYGPSTVGLEATEGFLHENSASKPAGRTPTAGTGLYFLHRSN